MPELSENRYPLPESPEAALAAAQARLAEIGKLDDTARGSEYLRLLKSLACRHYPRMTASAAVRSLIDAVSRWPERFHVSLAQLKLHLEAMFSPAELSRSRLYQKLAEIFPAGEVPHAGTDVPFHLLEPLASGEEMPALEMTRYASLLEAACRRADAGDGESKVKKGTLPYYRLEDGSWRLIFPAGFLEGLLRNCLESLSKLQAGSGR